MSDRSKFSYVMEAKSVITAPSEVATEPHEAGDGMSAVAGIEQRGLPDDAAFQMHIDVGSGLECRQWLAIGVTELE